MMPSTNAYRIIMESRGNKFCIYYENSAIYCKTIDFDGRAKESILIDSVYNNFLCSKSQDDNIYLLCQGRNKNFLLFTFDGEGWHMKELYLKRDLGNIIPLGLFALTNGIHIIYAKKLPIKDYYDLFQLTKIEDDWEKTFICEMYSNSMEHSLDIKMTDYDMLYLVSTLYDGEVLSLSYYNYNSKSNKWISMPIVNLSRNNISVKSLIYEKKINLLCYSIDNGTLNLFYFIKFWEKDKNFSLIDIAKLSPLSKDLDLVFELYNDNLRISYIGKNYYWENEYNISLKQWGGMSQIPLDKLPNLYYAKIINDNFDLEVEEKEALCLISDSLEISRPFYEAGIISGVEKNEKGINSNTAALIMEQIDLLCAEIEALNTKVNQIEEKVFLKYTAPRKEGEHGISHKAHSSALKESKFKEKFMKSKPASLKLESSTVLSGDIKSTDIAFPSFSDAVEEKQPAIIAEVEKEEPPAVISGEKKLEIKMPDEKYPNKSKGFIKSVSEWFK